MRRHALLYKSEAGIFANIILSVSCRRTARDMISLRYIIAICLLAAVVSAQITFSRDWTGGKRGEPRATRQALDCSQFTRLCRHFVDELKHAFSSEMRRNRNEAEQPLLYDDE